MMSQFPYIHAKLNTEEQRTFLQSSNKFHCRYVFPRRILFLLFYYLHRVKFARIFWGLVGCISAGRVALLQPHDLYCWQSSPCCGLMTCITGRARPAAASWHVLLSELALLQPHDLYCWQSTPCCSLMTCTAGRARLAAASWLVLLAEHALLRPHDLYYLQSSPCCTGAG